MKDLIMIFENHFANIGTLTAVIPLLAATLYSGQLSIAGIKLWPRQNFYTFHIIKPLYSGHLVIADIYFGPIGQFYLSIADI